MKKLLLFTLLISSISSYAQDTIHLKPVLDRHSVVEDSLKRVILRVAYSVGLREGVILGMHNPNITVKEFDALIEKYSKQYAAFAKDFKF